MAGGESLRHAKESGPAFSHIQDLEQEAKFLSGLEPLVPARDSW